MSRVDRAIAAQQDGITVAIARGDVQEELRRRRALQRLQSRRAGAERSAAAYIELLFRMEMAAARRGKRDWLAVYARDQRNGLGDQHMRAAEALRDHVEASTGSGGEIHERVDGGNIHNGQMEALCDRRRPGRYALNAAIDSVEDPELVVAAMVVILWGRSLPYALERAKKAKNSRNYKAVMVAMVEALDGAAAHIGISK